MSIRREFRLDVNQNGDQTVATVWHGRSEITGGAGDCIAFASRAFSGPINWVTTSEKSGDPDDFGRWACRDQREDRIRRQYVSEEMTGYEDLTTMAVGMK
jgi:hypothetical protein